MIVKKYISYAGIEKPETVAELKVELLGLRNAIKIAEELISRYEQVFAIMDLTREVAQNAPQTPSTSENKESEGTTRETSNGSEGETDSGA